MPKIIEAIKKIAGLTRPRLLTEAITHNDASTHAGEKFTSKAQYLLQTAVPLYVLWENPSSSPLNVELINRFFQTDSDGADLLVLWYYDITGATKTPLATFNENNEYIGIKDANFEVSALNALTTDPDTGVSTIAAYTPVDEGIIREPSSIPASGVGSNKSGDIDPAIGTRIYKPGTGYLIKITTRGNNNLTTLGYTWAENERD